MLAQSSLHADRQLVRFLTPNGIRVRDDRRKDGERRLTIIRQPVPTRAIQSPVCFPGRALLS
jgi:hypothetical protein